jgi:hypothetical protein
MTATASITVGNGRDLNFRPPPARHSARPSVQLAPGLGHALAKAAVETRKQGRAFGQLREGLHDLRLHLLDQGRPAAPPPWRGLKPLPGRPKALHGL